MKSNSINTRRVHLASTLLALIFIAAGAFAQTTPAPSPSPVPQAQPAPERQFFKNILRDQRAIWTSPFHLSRDDAKWLLPLGLSTAALVATDRYTAGALDENQSRLNVSRDLSYPGSIYGAGGVAAAFYLAGHAAHNARARETGLLGAEALIDSGIVSVALKSASQRPRPRVDDASGEFYDRGNSFPSGHALSAWSLATVIANEYRDRRLVQFTAYGLASVVSIARFTGRNHFLSDALVGSAVGYGIGRYVYRTHHAATLGTGGGGQAFLRERSKLWPSFAPLYNRHERDYGLALAWGF
ncbi:MAG TPA: phosphatase PAP2 family protein [Pyrinomonadaceae bacterium]|nr:phosphatase PAP2 family protein [Pyrinomonadaceae bacterium]